MFSTGSMLASHSKLSVLDVVEVPAVAVVEFGMKALDDAE
jgi:hypothetical protein